MTVISLSSQELLQRYKFALEKIRQLETKIEQLERDNMWLRLEFKGKLDEEYEKPADWDWDEEPELK